jgi:hypothetical protein
MANKPYGDPPAENLPNSRPQFNRKHGSLYDRGSADSWYGRGCDEPHWYPDGSYNGERITNLTEEEVAEYMAGYHENESDPGARKDWG